MKRLLLTACALGALLGPASAQVNTVPQVGTISNLDKQYTYAAVSISLATAASATDVFCIAGSASRTISVKEIRISGTGTANSVPFVLVRRAILDTGGTAATSTALPVAGKNYSVDPASVATLVAYTANPTINDASPTYLKAEVFNAAAANAQGGGTLVWVAGEAISFFSKGWDIPKSAAGATQQICINMNGVTLASPVVTISMAWIEQ